MLDYGGVAKGFAADEAKRILRDQGAKNDGWRTCHFLFFVR